MLRRAASRWDEWATKEGWYEASEDAADDDDD